jgi:hypothetical protein
MESKAANHYQDLNQGLKVESARGQSYAKNNLSDLLKTP